MKISKYLVFGAVAAMSLCNTACTGDLDLEPTDPNTKVEIEDKEQWDGYFGRLYYNYLADDIISCSDGGAGTFTRAHFNLNEITADECIISNKWNDPGYRVLNFNTWGSDNEWVYAAFSREFFNAKMCGEFIHEFPAKAAAFGYSDDEVTHRVAEAYALRALSYWYMIDCFGRGPWIEPGAPTGVTPPTYDRKQLFEAVTAELEAHVNELVPAAQQVYGRVTREAGYMLLAQLYLNAEVYTGEAMYDKCAAALANVVNTGIELAPEYKYLFCGTNDKYVGNGEILWAHIQNIGTTETWGGTTYLTQGCYIESAPADVLMSLNAGSATVWSGVRIRPELSKALKGDPRRMLYEGTFKEDVSDLDNYDANSCGYMCIKYSNSPEDDYLNTAGAVNNGTQVSPIDYPQFRLADAYLMAAECQARGASMSGLDGFALFNKVRQRVGLDPIAAPTLDQILHERQCELYMEGGRRRDLIRFGRYTGSNYLWSWKGGQYEGRGIDSYRDLFPIPYQYVSTVGQNPGYSN